MSEAFHIISDGSCDLPMEMTKEKDITVVPFYVSFEEGKYQKEMIEIGVREFYQEMVDHPDVYPKSSMPSVQDYVDAFLPFVKAGLPIKEVLEDATHNGGFFRYDNQLVVFPAITEHSEVTVGDALLHTLSGSPFYIVAEADDFFLCKGGQKRQHDLTITGKRIDVFFFKTDLNTQLL